MLRDDLIEVYRITRGMDKMSTLSLFLSVEDSKTRRHWLNLRGKRFKRDLRSNVYRVVRNLNKLPEEGVEMDTIATFK